MFYLKVRNNGLLVMCKLEKNNCFTMCRGCGTEITVDIEEAVSHCPVNGYDYFYCDKCKAERKEGED